VPVRAGSISGTFSGDSTLTPTGTPGVFVQNFTGDGHDDTYGAFTPASMSTIDFSHPPAVTVTDGVLSLTFSQGSFFGTASGHGTVNGTGMATFVAEFLITGGTGLFAGAMGEATITCTITETSSTTASISGSYIGSFSVPEPTALAQLATAVAVGSVVLFRRRRRQAMVHEPNLSRVRASCR
jgi:hypothetical protein